MNVSSNDSGTGIVCPIKFPLPHSFGKKGVINMSVASGLTPRENIEQNDHVISELSAANHFDPYSSEMN